MNAVIWWIRRDLRLGDNQALAGALGQGGPVIPLFILDPALLASPYISETRLGFLSAGLRALDEALRRRGSALVVRRGDPLEVLRELRAETGMGDIFAEADVSPYARARDERVGRALPLRLTAGLAAQPISAVRKSDGEPYTVFTPFSRAWLSLPAPGQPLPAPDRLPAFTSRPLPSLPAAELPGLPFTGQAAGLFPPGEEAARQRLSAFLDSAIYRYHEERNRMDLESTSGLSPYLRFGMLSARQATWAAREAINRAPDPAAQQGAATWLNELIWREFYLSILYHFPHVRRMAFRPALRSVRWRNNPAHFAAWCEGRTGYPVVDAAMRQLNQTGWMHNRARMITASFLTKDLLIDWRWGERYFMRRLLDGDPASNNGGWQWTAGTGTDAAPYFRIFHPVLQGLKFDPQGVYVRRWLPELAGVPGEFIHEPWKMTAEIQGRSGCVLGRDYPMPIVDHAEARQAALEAYKG